jgi:selenide,water dikinase
VLRQLPAINDPNLLSAAIPFADAGIYRIAEDRALVQSVDFFTPIVDDPATFGRIAAANALSDLYAVGATPLTALALAAFPACTLGTDALAAILRGGAETVAEAGAVIVGGHTVEDEEPKYGLAVTGLVDPRRMLTTIGARPGERLVLTKPLGTGILTTALKGEVVAEADIAAAIAGMCSLNRTASRVMLEVGVSACTDVTGFGLLGHALEMAAASNVLLVIAAAALPLYPHVKEMAATGLIPTGSYNNREYYLPRVVAGESLPPEIVDLIADPQTSGGLLMTVAAEKTDLLLTRLRAEGAQGWVIGRVEEGPAGKIRVE